jgi:hypothetical protein
MLQSFSGRNKLECFAVENIFNLVESLQTELGTISLL